MIKSFKLTRKIKGIDSATFYYNGTYYQILSNSSLIYKCLRKELNVT